jgi:tetratricopeptide (TPR) repeat protein
VPLALPAGYSEGRRRAFDDAITHLMRLGKSAEAERSYADAIAAYNAIDTYNPQARQRTEAGEARVRTWIAWGEADLAAGHFRAAYLHAEEALALLGSAQHPAAARALSLRDAAIERGTIYVAVAPVWRSDEAARRLSREFIAALNDELELNHWSQPPLFVAVIDPLVVRRELRRQGYSRTLLTPREAVRVGRGVGADYVVSGKILQVVTDEIDVKQEKRNARTTAGQDTTYVVRKGKRTVHLTTTYRVIDVQRSRGTHERTVEIDETGRFERGEYNGNPRELVLSRNERRLFDRGRLHDEAHEIEERLLEKTTVSLAQSVFEDLLNSVN